MRELLISQIVGRWIDGYDEFYSLYQEGGNNKPYEEYRQIQEETFEIPKTSRVQFKERIKSILMNLSDEILLELFESQCCQKYR